ncbi:atherin-like [Iris pallida]|uniref:Atherin-like n=1 Tax=Iris pallida TaxID=29817 RepID=A0AAX6HAP5_IRIPA|nr:atherin-like [Iris pallida]
MKERVSPRFGRSRPGDALASHIETRRCRSRGAAPGEGGRRCQRCRWRLSPARRRPRSASPAATGSRWWRRTRRSRQSTASAKSCSDLAGSLLRRTISSVAACSR